MNAAAGNFRIFQKIGGGMTAAFYAVFLFLFTFLTLGVLFSNIGYSYNRLLLFTFVFLFAAASSVLFRIIRTHAETLVKYERLILLLVLPLLFLIQMYLGFRLRFASAFDFASVYRGAIQWAETGTFSDYYEYYHYFPNNLGAMTLLFLVFKAAGLFGITDYFMLGVLLNAVMISLTVLTAYAAAKKLAGASGGAVCLFFFVTAPPFYILAAAFYTDSLSMLFPVLFYNVYLRLKQERREDQNRRRLLFVAMLVVITLGAMVKFTVMIMAVAVILDLVLSGRLRQACLTAAGICACFLIFQASFNAYLYQYHLDREQAARMNTPLTHWVMMGLNDSSRGAYHPDDYTFTRSFSDPKERNDAILDVIGERIQEQGFDGLTRLFSEKTIKAFGDGTYAISDFLDDGPEARGALHEYVLYDGKYYSRYKYLTQTALLGCYLFVLAGAAAALRKRDWSVRAPYLAVFGLILFLAVWESSSRYFLNFIPVLFLCAAYGGASKSVKYL